MSTFSVQGLPSSTSGAAHENVPTWSQLAHISTLGCCCLTHAGNRLLSIYGARTKLAPRENV